MASVEKTTKNESALEVATDRNDYNRNRFDGLKCLKYCIGAIATSTLSLCFILGLTYGPSYAFGYSDVWQEVTSLFGCCCFAMF